MIQDIVVPDYVVEGGWSLGEDGRWRFSSLEGQNYTSNWVPVFNPYADLSKGQSAFDWFFFDEAGGMLTGWYTDSQGNTYYLNPLSDNTLGAMKTGWVQIDGKSYYFNNQADGTRGRMLRSTTTPDGHVVDEHGALVQ